MPLTPEELMAEMKEMRAEMASRMEDVARESRTTNTYLQTQVAMMDAQRKDVEGLQKTVYGDDGKGGLVSDVSGLQSESRLTKGVLVYVLLPVITGAAVIIVLKAFGVA